MSGSLKCEGLVDCSILDQILRGSLDLTCYLKSACEVLRVAQVCQSSDDYLQRIVGNSLDEIFDEVGEAHYSVLPFSWRRFYLLDLLSFRLEYLEDNTRLNLVADFNKVLRAVIDEEARNK